MKKSMHTVSIRLSLAMAVAFSAHAVADIKIGVGAPFTGPNAAFGDQIWRGAAQAAADINASGGVNGEKIVLVKGDDACEPKQAVAAANQMVNVEHVVGVIAHYCSSSAIPATEIYDEAQIIAITLRPPVQSSLNEGFPMYFACRVETTSKARLLRITSHKR